MKKLYHASSVHGIEILEPRTSNHGIPQVYFSEKRENVLVYLSNAIEKCCREHEFHHDGIWQKWGPYGFTKEGVLHFEEYYPNALRDTYMGVKAYIYTVEKDESMVPLGDVPFAYVSKQDVPVVSCECVEDAYAEMIDAEARGLIRITRYEELSEKKLNWIKNIMRSEYESSADKPEYRFFIEKRFWIK